MTLRTLRATRISAFGLLLLALGACAGASRWQGLTAGQLFELGRTEFESEEYGKASETLDQLLLAVPTFEQAADAQLLLARAYSGDRKYILAQSEFTQFLDRYPAHPLAPQAALGMCEANKALSPIPQRDQTFTLQAVQICRNVAADWQGTPEAEAAAAVVAEMRAKLAQNQYQVGSYYLRRGAVDSAILYYRELLAGFADTEWAPRALVGIIDAYTRIGYDDEIEAARTRLLDQYPDSPEARALAASGGDSSRGG